MASNRSARIRTRTRIRARAADGGEPITARELGVTFRLSEEALEEIEEIEEEAIEASQSSGKVFWR